MDVTPLLPAAARDQLGQQLQASIMARRPQDEAKESQGQCERIRRGSCYTLIGKLFRSSSSMMHVPATAAHLSTLSSGASTVLRDRTALL